MLHIIRNTIGKRERMFVKKFVIEVDINIKSDGDIKD